MANLSLKDIAEKTGFSISVVSRVLNMNPDKNARVSEETRALIEETARKLGYRHNRVAEFLKKGKSPAIGVFLPTYSNRLIADLIMGLSEKANEKGFPVNYYFGLTVENYLDFFSRSEDLSHPGIITYPDLLLRENIIMEKLREYRAKHGSVLLLNSDEIIDDEITSVANDNYVGGGMAAEQLIRKSCRTFLTLSYFKGRSEGFKDLLKSSGHKAATVEIENLKNRMAALKKDPSGKPVGIFAVTDELALKAIKILKNSGWHIGSDALVIGYDDLGLTELCDPPLTTVHQCFLEEGRLAMEKLVNMIYGKKEENIKIKPHLVIRESA